MTQRQIAESFTPPITPAAVSNWENDVVGPSFDAEEIARVYKCKLIDALTAINETRRSRRAENTAKATAAP